MQLAALKLLGAKQVQMEAHYAFRHQLFAAAVEFVYCMGQTPADQT